MNLIIPAVGQHQQVAADLLSLARSPLDVATNTDDGLAFVVPDYLAQAYANAMAEVSKPQQPAAPKRGRARKET